MKKKKDEDLDKQAKELSDTFQTIIDQKDNEIKELQN